MLKEHESIKLADLYKMFGDPTRLKILYALFESKQSVSELCTKIEMSQSATSHQLRILKDHNLISYERSGKQMIYGLSDDHVRDILSQGLTHIRHI